MVRFEAVPALATATPFGASQSQDYAAVVELPGVQGGASIVVCDGAGAFEGSGPVAREVTELAAAALGERSLEDGIRALPIVVSQTKPARYAAEVEAPAEYGETTLLVLSADGTGCVGHFMVGNGMLVEAEPRLPGSKAAGMSWIGLALPQISVADGHPALRSFLPCADPAALEYAAGVRKTSSKAARIFLACSDGIASDEECSTGFAPNGTQWKEVPTAFARLLSQLAADWLAICDSTSPKERLDELLRTVLDELLAEGALADDATVGALLLRAIPDQAELSSR